MFGYNSLSHEHICREHILAANLLGGTFVYNASARQFKEQPKTLLSAKPSNKRTRTQSDDTSTDTCTGCGRTGHIKPKCQFLHAKYFNNGNGKYENPQAYANLLKDRPNHKDKTCPRDTHKPGNKSVSAIATSPSDTASASQTKEPFKKKSKSTLSFIVSDTTVALRKPISEPNFTCL